MIDRLRALTADPVEASQVTRGTTWYGDPGISSDGSTLYYLRGDALGDNVYSLELESGEEEALTAQPLPGGSEVRTSPDGRWLAFNLVGPEHRHLELVEFPSGRRTTRVLDEGHVRYAHPLDGGALVGFSPDQRRLVFLDSLGGLPRIPDLPPLPHPAFSPSPDGGRVAFAAPDTTGVVTLWVASLPAGGDAVGRPLDGDLDVPGITWATDGLVYLTRWLEEDDMPSLWSADPDGGALRRVVDLPVLCDFLHIVLSRDASRAVCKASDYRSDVWWIDGSGW